MIYLHTWSWGVLASQVSGSKCLQIWNTSDSSFQRNMGEQSCFWEEANISCWIQWCVSSLRIQGISGGYFITRRHPLNLRDIQFWSSYTYILSTWYRTFRCSHCDTLVSMQVHDVRIQGMTLTANLCIGAISNREKLSDHHKQQV